MTLDQFTHWFMGYCSAKKKRPSQQEWEKIRNDIYQAEIDSRSTRPVSYVPSVWQEPAPLYDVKIVPLSS